MHTKRETLNVRWEHEWSCSCCETPGRCRSISCQRVWAQRGIMGASQGKDANTLSWTDKNRLRSDGAPRPAGANGANKSLCSALGGGLMERSAEIGVAASNTAANGSRADLLCFIIDNYTQQSIIIMESHLHICAQFDTTLCQNAQHWFMMPIKEGMNTLRYTLYKQRSGTLNASGEVRISQKRMWTKPLLLTWLIIEA